MPRPEPDAAGVGARRAALQMLDSVLRQGRTLEVAAQAVGGLTPPDHGLAVAIAGEALRRLPDLDALIDSATQRALPSDSKARMVLRLALAQKIGLGTPDHALVATALPLVDGGPRRLVHGVLGTLLRRGLAGIVARTAALRPRPEISLTTNAIGLERTAADYKGMVVAWRNGSPVRLGEVANVAYSVENELNAAWMYSQGRVERAINMQIMKQPAKFGSS